MADDARRRSIYWLAAATVQADKEQSHQWHVVGGMLVLRLSVEVVGRVRNACTSARALRHFLVLHFLSDVAFYLLLEQVTSNIFSERDARKREQTSFLWFHLLMWFGARKRRAFLIGLAWFGCFEYENS